MAGFASFLFGLRAQQPGEYRRIQRIGRSIYTTVAALQAEIVRSPEPIPFDQLDRAAFRPVRNGASWGGVFDCAWLRITGDVPSGVDNVEVQLGIRGEGLAFSADGQLLDSVSTVFQQADLPHSAGRYRPVRNVDMSTGRVEFFADVTYNGFILYEVGRPAFHGARLVTRDPQAYALFYDYLTLLVLAGATEDAALESQLRSALKASYRAFTQRDLDGARSALAPALARASDSDFTYSAIGHGHLDMAWLWPLRETRRKAARTYVRALNTIDERDEYIYGTSQPQQMLWMKQRHPALFDRLKRAVADGRVEIQGSFWIEPDTNLPSGESLVRQAVVGRRFLQEEFNLSDEQLRLCWLPDTFGYNGNLPQILRGSGMDWFQTIKLAWNKVNDFPHRSFHWQGIDGSSVLVHMPPEGDYNSRGAADGLLTGLKKYPERALNAALLVYGSGDGGGGPGEIHHEVTTRERSLYGLPRVEQSTASDFFRRLETLDVSHVHEGELYLETHQGTYTTQGAIKRHNRIVERMLHEVEALAVITGNDSRPELEQHWREVLLNQFHDIIPGSSIARVNREAIETYERIEASLDDYSQALVEQLPPGTALTALNLTSFDRAEAVKVGHEWFSAAVGPYAAAELRPLTATGLAFTENSMSNGLLTVRFGASGEIVSCLDVAGAEHAADGLNRLTLHRDPYVWPFNAWDIDVDYFEKKPRTLRMTPVSTSIDGPTVVRVQQHRSRKVTITQRVILETGSAVVRFETDVDWHQKHRMLRAEFRPTHFGEAVQCEIQFGHISRVTTENDSVERAQFEVCAHKWIATDDATGGFALLNDGKYGHRAKNGLLSINLLRAPTYPDKTADRGHHRFSYAFMPFQAGELAPVIAEGYRLNNPLHVITGAELTSQFATSDQGVVIETVKRAEKGSGVVVRMYESLGRHTSTGLRVAMPYSRAIETDLIERPHGEVDLANLRFAPFEIKTILLETR
jgi:alpha-mannosidase